jgi:hypothetical protein
MSKIEIRITLLPEASPVRHRYTANMIVSPRGLSDADCVAILVETAAKLLDLKPA